MDKKQILLVERAVAGKKGALEQLLECYMKDIFYLAAFYSDRQEGEDIAQNVAITICEKIHTLSEPASFLKWLSITVRNASMDHMRKISKLLNSTVDLGDSMESNEEVLHIKNTEFLPEEYVEDAELRGIVIEEIEKLPGNQRMCMAYHYLYEMKRSEIAEVTGLTPRQVSTGLNYGKQTLKKKLEERLGTRFVYSVAPITALPVLARVFQADVEAFVSQELCKQIVQDAMKYIGVTSVAPNQGASGAAYPTTLLSCVAGTVVVSGVILAVIFSGGESTIEEVASPIQEVITQELVEELYNNEEPEPVEEPLQDDWEIRTVADMIGQEEADRLEQFVNSVHIPEEWQQFVQRIGVEEDWVAVELNYIYTTYTLEKQNKRLVLAQQKSADGQVRVVYLFGDRDEPVATLAKILLEF